MSGGACDPVLGKASEVVAGIGAGNVCTVFDTRNETSECEQEHVHNNWGAGIQLYK